MPRPAPRRRGNGGSPRDAAPGAARAASSSTTAVAAAAAAAAQAAQFAKPFADVVKDAKESQGLFNLWQKDEKVWIELEPEQFDRPFFFKSAVNHGIGESRIFGGAMTYPIGLSQIVVFHKHGQTVQLIAKNVKYTAAPARRKPAQSRPGSPTACCQWRRSRRSRTRSASRC